MKVAPSRNLHRVQSLGSLAPLKQMSHFSSLSSCYANEHLKALKDS